jgi:hypothetical protein
VGLTNREVGARSSATSEQVMKNHLLARILLLLAHFGKEGVPQTVIPKMSQETLAEMIGTTRARVSCVAKL